MKEMIIQYGTYSKYKRDKNKIQKVKIIINERDDNTVCKNQGMGPTVNTTVIRTRYKKRR